MVKHFEGKLLHGYHYTICTIDGVYDKFSMKLLLQEKHSKK